MNSGLAASTFARCVPPALPTFTVALEDLLHLCLRTAQSLVYIAFFLLTGSEGALTFTPGLRLTGQGLWLAFWGRASLCCLDLSHRGGCRTCSILSSLAIVGTKISCRVSRVSCEVYLRRGTEVALPVYISTFLLVFKLFYKINYMIIFLNIIFFFAGWFPTESCQICHCRIKGIWNLWQLSNMRHLLYLNFWFKLLPPESLF